MSLSDKIEDRFDLDRFVYIKDVKEAVKKLTDIMLEKRDWFGDIDTIWLKEQIDKIFGEKLI